MSKTSTLQVHIWPQHGNMVGHASLSFGTAYVSFWPDGEADKKDLKLKTTHPGYMVSSLGDDIRNEGNRQPITVTIRDINIKNLSDFISKLRSNTPRYQIARYNCSHVVAECLKAACEDAPSFKPTAHGYYGKFGELLGRGIWTPYGVLRYAKELSARHRVRL